MDAVLTMSEEMARRALELDGVDRNLWIRRPVHRGRQDAWTDEYENDRLIDESIDQ